MTYTREITILVQQNKEWIQKFESLLARVYATTRHFSPQEIEDDITAAAQEVKDIRQANNHSSLS